MTQVEVGLNFCIGLGQDLDKNAQVSEVTQAKSDIKANQVCSEEDGEEMFERSEDTTVEGMRVRIKELEKDNASLLKQLATS